jgi:hypothetical protein
MVRSDHKVSGADRKYSLTCFSLPGISTVFLLRQPHHKKHHNQMISCCIVLQLFTKYNPGLMKNPYLKIEFITAAYHIDFLINSVEDVFARTYSIPPFSGHFLDNSFILHDLQKGQNPGLIKASGSSLTEILP